MKLLRTVSTQRLLAIIAGLVIAVAGGTAIAFAAAGRRRAPAARVARHGPPSGRPRRPPSPASARRISFTNNLIDSTDIQGSDPILSGASGRLWLSTTHASAAPRAPGPERRRPGRGQERRVLDLRPDVEHRLQGHAADQRLQSTADKSATEPIPTVAQIQSRAEPADAARRRRRAAAAQRRRPAGVQGRALAQALGRAARERPARLGRGPRRPARHRDLLDKQQPTGARAQGHRHLLRRAVPPSVFKISAPAGAKVVRISSPAHAAPRHAATAHGKAGAVSATPRPHAEITGAAAVQAHVPFTLAAPGSLDGLQQQSVQLLDWGGSPAALVTYGEGLGGIAVIEQTASSQSSSRASPERLSAASASRRVDQRPQRAGAPDGARHGAARSRAAASSTRCSGRCRQRGGDGGEAAGALTP